MKVIITEVQYGRAIDFYISHLLEPHEVKTSEKYPNSIFWIKDGKIIVEIENLEDDFWLRSDLWTNISIMFNLEYSEIQSVIKEWLKQHHNLGKFIPGRMPSLFAKDFNNI